VAEFDSYDVQTHSGSGFQRQLVYLEQPSHRLLGGPAGSGEAEEGVTNLYPKRTFRYFRYLSVTLPVSCVLCVVCIVMPGGILIRAYLAYRSEAVENVMKMICLYLGRYGDLHSLLDHFFQVRFPSSWPFPSVRLNTRDAGCP
jgi:hypothetical protein